MTWWRGGVVVGVWAAMVFVTITGLLGCSRHAGETICAAGDAACSVPQRVPLPPRFYADPPYGLGFGCVTVGCHDTRLLTLQNRGDGEVVITRIRIGPASSNDFTMQIVTDPQADPLVQRALPTSTDPFTLKANDKVFVMVTYAPSDAQTDSGVLEVRWYDGAVAFEEAIIQKVDMPLTARTLGTASSRLRSQDINFGYVQTHVENQKYLEIENTSVIEAVVGITQVDVSKLPNVFAVGVGWSHYANPGERVRIPIIFSPQEEASYHGTITIYTNDPNNPSFDVDVKGTSIDGVALKFGALVPPLVDMGSLRLGATAQRSVTVTNEGGRDAVLVPYMLEGRTMGFEVEGPWGHGDAVRPVVLKPFDAMNITVHLTPTQGGVLSGRMDMGDGTKLDMTGYGLAPMLRVSEEVHNFGILVDGWVTAPTPIYLTNTGMGDLTITSIEVERDPARVRISSDVAFPIRLAPGAQPFPLNVYVQALSLGQVDADIAIHSDSIDTPLHRVHVAASIVTCDVACPIAHGHADCSHGYCSMGPCDAGWHDTDGKLTSGCECQEERGGHDVGGVCSTGVNLGNVGDECSSAPDDAYASGILHSLDDVDLYFIHNIDESKAGCDVFDDSSQIMVELVDGPPGLALCVQIRSSGAGCGGYTSYFDPTVCGQRSYEYNGSWGPSDDRDTTAWVLWRPGAAPVCQPYSLHFSGND